MAYFNPVPYKGDDGKTRYRAPTKEEKERINRGGASAARDVYGAGSGQTIAGVASGQQQTSNVQAQTPPPPTEQQQREAQARALNLAALEKAKQQGQISQRSYEELKANLQNEEQIKAAVEEARVRTAQQVALQQQIEQRIQQGQKAEDIIKAVRELPPEYQNPENQRAVAQYAGQVSEVRTEQQKSDLERIKDEIAGRSTINVAPEQRANAMAAQRKAEEFFGVSGGQFLGNLAGEGLPNAVRALPGAAAFAAGTFLLPEVTAVVGAGLILKSIPSLGGEFAEKGISGTIAAEGPTFIEYGLAGKGGAKANEAFFKKPTPVSLQLAEGGIITSVETPSGKLIKIEPLVLRAKVGSKTIIGEGFGQAVAKESGDVAGLLTFDFGKGKTKSSSVSAIKGKITQEGEAAKGVIISQTETTKGGETTTTKSIDVLRSREFVSGELPSYISAVTEVGPLGSRLLEAKRVRAGITQQMASIPTEIPFEGKNLPTTIEKYLLLEKGVSAKKVQDEFLLFNDKKGQLNIFQEEIGKTKIPPESMIGAEFLKAARRGLIEPVEPTRSFAFITNFKNMGKIDTITNLDVGLTTSPLFDTNLKINSDTRQQPSFKPIQDIFQDTFQDRVLRTKQQQRSIQEQRLIQETFLKRGMDQRFMPNITIPKKFSEMFDYNKGRRQVTTEAQAYSVELRRGDKRGDRFQTIARNLPYNKALAYGASAADGNIENTFRITKAGKTSQPDDWFAPDLSKFRAPYGKTKLPVGSFVEKKKFRLDDPREVAQISFFKKQKQSMFAFT